MKTLLKKRPVRYAPIPESETNWDSVRVLTTKLHRSRMRTKVVIVLVFLFILVFWWAMFSAQVGQLDAYYRKPWMMKKTTEG
jgi:hypothetical protein